MNKIILYLVLIISFKLCAQDLNYLKAQDTIYLSVEKLADLTTTNLSFDKFDLIRTSNGIQTEYVLSEKDTVSKKIFIIIRLDPLKPLSDLPIEVKRKKFFEENKNRIINLDFISRYTPEELFFRYLGLKAYMPLKKVVYIIDDDKVKRQDKKILLRKASIISIGYLRI